MPSSYTPNYSLNQWEPDDRVLRTDFNADNAKIDAALGALSRDLPGKLGRMEIIETRNSNGGTYKSVGFGPPDIDWSEWEYVCFLAQYPGQTASGTVPLSFGLRFRNIDDEVFVGPLALPGYLVVTLPRHGASKNLGGFVLSDRFVPFSFEHTFQSITDVAYVVDNRKQMLIHPNIVVFGGK